MEERKNNMVKIVEEIIVLMLDRKVRRIRIKKEDEEIEVEL